MNTIPIYLTSPIIPKVVAGEHNADALSINLSNDLQGYSTYIIRRMDGYGRTSDSPRLYAEDNTITMPLTDDILRGVSLRLQVIGLDDNGTEVSKSEILKIPIAPSLRMDSDQKQKSTSLLTEMVEVLRQASEAVIKVDGAVFDANDAVKRAETAVETANQAVQSVGDAADKANTAAESANQAAAAVTGELDLIKINEEKQSDGIVSDGLLGNFSVVPENNGAIKTFGKNICIVLKSYSNTVKYGTLIKADLRGVQKGKEYTLSFDTPNTGAEVVVKYDTPSKLTKFTLDGTRKHITFTALNDGQIVNDYIHLSTEFPSGSGKITNVMLCEGDDTGYVEFSGETIDEAIGSKEYKFSVKTETSVYCNSEGGYKISSQIPNKEYIDKASDKMVEHIDVAIEETKDYVLQQMGRKKSNLLLVTYGDSLFASGNDLNENSWQKKVTDYFGITNHVGVSIGGAGFANLEERRFNLPEGFVLGDNLPNRTLVTSSGAVNANYCSWERISATIPENADIIIIGTGANDIGTYAGKTPIEFVEGNTADEAWSNSEHYAKYNGDFNLVQMYGAIMSTIMKIQCRAPNAKIILTNWCNSRSSNKNTEAQPLPDREEITIKSLNAIKYAAQLCGVPLVDLFATSGINQFNRDKYVIDLIHLNPSGYALMGEAIINAMKSII